MRAGEQRARRALIEEFLDEQRRAMTLCPLGPNGCLVSMAVCRERQVDGVRGAAEGGNYTRHPTMKPHPNYLWCQSGKCPVGKAARSAKRMHLSELRLRALQHDIKKWRGEDK